MPTLAATLRHEIRRLASAEFKKALRPLSRIRKQAKSLRLESRGQKRTLLSLERSLRRLRDRLSAQALKGRLRKPAVAPRIAPRAVRALRARLKMTRLRFAKLLGVSPGSIFGWETGRTIPRGANQARLLELGGKKDPGGRRGRPGRPKGRRPRRR